MDGLSACRVRVPCSTSNLGSGFDCIGLALNRYLEASFEPGGTGLRLERCGTLAGLDMPAAEDRLAAAFVSGFQAIGGAPDGTLRVTSEIPVARGLGSSAAAVVAGLVLARITAGRRLELDEHAFDPIDVVADAVALEKHPDNVGAALLGGLVAAIPRAREPGRSAAFDFQRLALSPDIGFAFAAPATAVDTGAARAALPETVTHAAAARSVARIAALLHGLATADAGCLRAGFDDELHVPFRLPRIPGAERALAAALAAGAWAATISGSGSGLIAACPAGAEAAVASVMKDSLGGTAAGAIGFTLRPDAEGTRII